MSNNRWRAGCTVFAGIAALLLTAGPNTAAAQDYPTRPVRLVVPFPPGGSNDIVGRLVGAGLGERLGKQIQVIGHIRSGKLRALATSGGKRSAIVPDVPTISKAGVPGYETANWWGIAAPSGTPAPVIRRLSDEIKAVLRMPETATRLINEGAEPVIKTPEELGQHVASEMAKWVKVANIAGIRGD